MLLLTNRRDRSAGAVYGKIRVLAGWERLPAAAVSQPRLGQRLVAAYFDRPLIPEKLRRQRGHRRLERPQPRRLAYIL